MTTQTTQRTEAEVKLREKCLRKLEELSTVDYGSLSDEEKRQHNTEYSLYGAIAHAPEPIPPPKRYTTTNGNRPEGLPTVETLRRLAS